MKQTTRLWVGAVTLALTATGIALGLRGTAQKGEGHHVTVADDVQSDGARVLPNGWRISPAGRPIPLPGDMPLKMVFSPDGKSLLVNTGGFHDHSLSVIDVASEKIVQSVDVAKDWAGLSIDSDGDVYVAGGGTPSRKFLNGVRKAGGGAAQLAAVREPILSFRLTGASLAPQPSLDLPGLSGNERWVAGLASGADGALYVANVNNDTVYKLAGQPKTLQTSAHVGYRPYAVALSPDGKTLAVSNWGDQSVSLLDPGTLAEQAHVAVGSHPNEITWGRDGRLFVACSGSNSVSVIQGGKAVETIKTSLSPDDPVGSTPDALTLSPDGKRLYVANADNNDVAVIDVSDAHESQLLGFIPTGWYPSALAVSPDGRRLFIGTAKGLKFRANAHADTRPQSSEAEGPYDYIPDVLSGTVNVVDVPDAKGLADYTRQVRADTPTPKTAVVADPGVVTEAQDAFHHIQHVVYIIRENRTYDQVFGDLAQGNGDPNLCLFGRSVTPNAHALASQYVLLDNLYCNGEVSEDGHQWCDAAYADDFNEKAWTNSYSGRGEPDADARLTASPAGYLWDDCGRHGLTFRTYGEASSFKSSPDAPPVFTGNSGLAGHASYDYARIPPFTGDRDLGRAGVFISDLHSAEKTGDWPRFMVMSLGEDHTQGLKAGTFTPTAHVADNDQALGKIVEAVSHSKFWPTTAIFVIEDDAQNGPDHVDAHRTVGLVISPYVRHRVDSTLYTTASFVRTMELILGLPPMTQYDRAATPLYASFGARPALTAFDCLASQVSLEARNPAAGTGAVASAKLDLSEPDRADPDALNAILWHALRPGVPQPAPVRSASLLRP